jgi:hypothetical protein
VAKSYPQPQYREFQRCSIDRCYAQLFGQGNNRTKRFLIADEVGLGKTILARGLIEKLLERKTSCSIVYVCSSLDIINQNRTKLDPAANSSAHQPGRITLLRAYGASRKRIRFYLLTPGTSLFIKNSTGIVEERLYMAWLARKLFRISEQRAIQLFKCNAPSFGRYFRQLSLSKFKPLNKRNYGRLRRGWRELSKDIRYGARDSFRRTVTALRLKLAKMILGSLDPDLIILDEFQKFKDILLEPDKDPKNLCAILVRHGIPTLLLSATPYRLLSKTGRPGSPDDVNHYDEFRDVLAFLTGDSRHARDLLKRIWQYGIDIRNLTADTWKARLIDLLKKKHELEMDLTTYMSRTERVFFQFEEMNPVETRFLSKHEATETLTKDEIKEYLFLSKRAPRKEVLGYWKSGSHLMSYLQDYVLGHKLRKDPAFTKNKFLYTSFQGGKPRSSKIEYLANDIFKEPASSLYLWLPPLRPYYPGRGLYGWHAVKRAGVKKGLVFSAWKFVPRFIAAELSRRHDAQFRRKPLKYQMKITPVTWATFFFPSLKLADLVAHHDFVNAKSYDELKRTIVMRVRQKLVDMGVELRPRGQSAKPWELLRHLEYFDDQAEWKKLIRRYRQPISRSRQNGEHRTTVAIEPRYLAYLDKPFQKKLVANDQAIEQLASIAIASPAVAILRAVRTIAGSCTEEILEHLGQLCMVEVRSFIARSSTVQCVRSAYRRGTYSRRVGEYFRDGNIQAVLDEYLFCIAGELDKKNISKEQLEEVLSKLRCIFQYRKSVLRPFKGRRSKHMVNTHVAMAFGESQDEGVSRDDLRVAFNSPFWPFVLSTTSVGQEGLDFHLYCKNIYHWNLPCNPVDFEQREGRLNRYNSLTVREAVTSVCSNDAGNLTTDRSIWLQVFGQANAHCHYNDRYNWGLSPNWMCTPLNATTHSHLIRHILDLPHSSDLQRYHALMDRLRLYRLALGQPNPDSYLRDLERNGFLKTIDTRSLYLNLFPFSSRSRHAQFASILAEQDRYKLLLSDAKTKASQLERMDGGRLLKRLVRQTIASLQKRINGNYDKVIMKPSLRRLLGSLHDFVDVHDKINDRVPAIGYQDDIKRLQQALRLTN